MRKHYGTFKFAGGIVTGNREFAIKSKENRLPYVLLNRRGGIVPTSFKMDRSG